MAKRTRRSASRSSRRSAGAGSGYRKRSASKRPYRAAAPRKSSGRRRARSTARPQTVRIVLEHAGAAPVREGEQVGIGMKVAKAPRLKPRF